MRQQTPEPGPTATSGRKASGFGPDRSDPTRFTPTGFNRIGLLGFASLLIGLGAVALRVADPSGLVAWGGLFIGVGVFAFGRAIFFAGTGKAGA